MDLEILTSVEQWKQWAHEGWSLLPFIIQSKQSTGGLPSSWKTAWGMASPYSVVLESGKGGRFTYLGLTPVSVLKGIDNSATVLSAEEDGGENPERRQPDPQHVGRPAAMCVHRADGGLCIEARDHG